MIEIAEVKYAKSMRILGWAIIVICIVFFGLATAVYEFFVGTHLGYYWGGILIVLTGAVAASSRNRGCVVFGIVVSILAMIVGAVAFTLGLSDAYTFALFTGCYNTDTGKAWGTSKGKREAISCALNDTLPFYDVSDAHTRVHDLQHYNYYYNKPHNNDNNFFYNHPNWTYYYNQNHVNDWYDNHNTAYWDRKTSGRTYNYNFENYQCVCTDQYWCYGYDLTKGNDCGEIMTSYTDMVVSSAVLLLILLVLTFVYSIHACCSAFRSSEVTVPATTIEVTPVQVQMAGAEYAQPDMSGQLLHQQPAVVYGISSAPAAQYAAQYAPVPMSVDVESVAVGNEKFV